MKTIVAVAMMALSAGAAAQINKCFDANGKVVAYGECPPGTRSAPSAIKSSPAPTAAPAKSVDAGKSAPAATAAPKTAAERDADYRKRQMDQQEADKKGADKSAIAEQNKRACDAAQADLKSLQAGNRISRTDPKTGERVYLQDNEYAGEIAKTQAKIKLACR